MKLWIILCLLTFFSVGAYSQDAGKVRFNETAWNIIVSQYNPNIEKLYCLYWHREQDIAYVDSVELIGTGNRLSITKITKECDNPTLHTHPPEYPDFDGNDYMMMFNSKMPFFCLMTADKQLKYWPSDPFSK